MFDVAFRGEFVPNNYHSVVAREAVLSAIYETIPRSPRLAEVVVPRLVKKAIRQWRARVDLLADAGWRALQDDSNSRVQYMRNCRPYFMAAYPATRSCNRVVICPFCYGRWVSEMWKRIADRFPGDFSLPEGYQAATLAGGTGDPYVPRGRAMLLDGAHDDSLPNRYSPVEDRIYTHHAVFGHIRREFRKDDVSLSKVIDKSFANRAKAIRALDPVGALLVSSVIPLKHTWCIQHRIMFAVPADKELPPDFKRACSRYVRIVRPARPELVRVAALTCSYPVPLLTGDADDTVSILHALEGKKMRLTYGCFRKQRIY